jgi:excisionase family DNA binding protein
VVATAPVTVEQAAAVLGVSASTVRRRIRQGSLRAEPAARPQGVVWLVHLPPDATAAADQPPPSAGVVATAPATDAMLAYTKTLLEPLVAALERSQARVGALERENGELVTRLALAEERLAALQPVDLEPPPTPEPSPPTTLDGKAPWWRRWLLLD